MSPQPDAEPAPDEGFEVEWRRERPPAKRAVAAPEFDYELDAGVAAGRAPSRAAGLQRRLGNGGLLQLRARMQRRTFSGAETPQWMKDEVGITAESERSLARAESVTSAASEMSIPSGGRPLDAGVRASAEQDLGVSLSGVRLVEDDAAASSVDALAFASGDAVVLSRQVDLDSRDGQFTLMHELAHVAQQKRGEADALDGLGGDAGVREGLEQSADGAAARILRKLDETAT